MESKPLVSVCMITYNHESYIVEAIEGVMMQKTDFPIELIIGEDCSTDNTHKICLEYKEKYPDKIKLLLPETNLGMSQNFLETIKNCTGKYIALCEGDDYWTDTLKLQKQVDFLEENSDFNICVHQTDILENDMIVKKEWRFNNQRQVFNVIDYIYRLFFHTSSAVFRKMEFSSYLNNSNILQGDIALFLSVILDKKVYFIPQSMSVYRLHEHGITKTPFFMSKLNTYNSLLLIFDKFNEYSNRNYKTTIWLKKQTILSLMLIYCNDKGNAVSKLFVKWYYYFIKILLLLRIRFFNKL